MKLTLILPLVVFCSVINSFADGSTDNLAEKVRRVPPPGIAIAQSDRAELEKGAGDLDRQIEALRVSLTGKPALLELLPDIQVFHKAVDWALRYDEFYKTNEPTSARALLQLGEARARALGDGRVPWNSSTGLVVRGYLSTIDGSIQPYGLVVPSSFAPNSAHKFRLDFWFHGRGEQLTEIDFLNGRLKSPGEFTPPDTIVCHLYGRYCNANKFAGEIDLFETWADIRKHYPIDENRVVIRGFSMGGAACWQFAVHYPSLWAAAAPGAGFSETPDFLKVFQKEELKPSWFEQKLWRWYDCTEYAVNLFNCPTVAYSGEIDNQKQAADLMATALAKEGIKLTHIIGPQTGHKYHPDAKAEINRRIDSIAAQGRDPLPSRVKFATHTLRYNQSAWVTVDGLEQHWEQARVEAEIDQQGNGIKAVTRNIAALTLAIPAGLAPFDPTRKVSVSLDGQMLNAASAASDRSWTAHFTKQAGNWSLAPINQSATDDLRKRHGLQGPIDDAFMDSFMMVRPTGQPLNAKAGTWASNEQAHAVEHWRRQFRGEARVKADTEVTDADIASHNLVLWGDPSSNQLLGRIAGKLPLRWDAQGVHTGDAIFPADRYVPVLICPNPLNPKRYVVINSGFTFREYDYLNNARQVAKLPDWAIVDFTQPVTSRAPGGITAAGFFNERWELPKK